MEKDNKSFIWVGLGLIILLLLILLVVFIISKTRNKYLTYEKVIEKMERATIKYYEKNPKPLDVGDHYLAYDTLVNAELIKPLNELLANGDECSAHVIVINKDAHYSYTPYLKCGENYETIELYKKLIDPNNIVTAGSGLYKNKDNEYYYRGEVTNNYIKLGTVKKEDKEVDNIWRIMSIDENGIIKIRNTRTTNSTYVWDDRYNVTMTDNYGYNDFEMSRFKETLLFLGNRDSVMNEKYRNKLVAKKLCVAKRGDDDPSKDGSTECSIMSNDLFNVGTMTPYEYMRASLDDNCIRTISHSCANYNYLVNNAHASEWLLTAYKGNNHQSYSFGGSTLTPSTDDTEKYIYLTAYLTDKSFYLKGTGTLNDPYEIR